MAHAICCDWGQAEDAVLRTLARLEDSWPHLADAAEADSFIHRALARLDVHRLPDPPQLRRTARDDFPVEDESLIFDGLQSLPAIQRKVLVLHDWLDLPADEVADALGIDVARCCATRPAVARRSNADARAGLTTDLVATQLTLRQPRQAESPDRSAYCLDPRSASRSPRPRWR